MIISLCTIALIIMLISLGIEVLALLTVMMSMLTGGWQFAYIYPKWAMNEIYASDLSTKTKYRFKIKKRDLYYQIVVYKCHGILSALLNRKFDTVEECEKFIISHINDKKRHLEKLIKFNNIQDLTKLEKLNKLLQKDI